METSLRSRLDAVLQASAYRTHLGATLASWGDGAAVVTVVPGDATTNLGGSVHGGLLASLADLAFEAACNSWGRQVVATGLTLHYAAAASPGVLLQATASERTRTRRVASYDVAVRSGERTVAWAQATAFRTDGWHLGADAWPPQWRAAH